MHAPPPPPPPPSSSWSSFQGDGSETSFLEALANAQLLYRHAHKLSGVSFEDFCSLTPAVRHNYLRTTLEQLDRSALYRDIAMSRFRAVSLASVPSFVHAVIVVLDILVSERNLSRRCLVKEKKNTDWTMMGAPTDPGLAVPGLFIPRPAVPQHPIQRARLHRSLLGTSPKPAAPPWQSGCDTTHASSPCRLALSTRTALDARVRVQSSHSWLFGRAGRRVHMGSLVVLHRLTEVFGRSCQLQA